MKALTVKRIFASWERVTYTCPLCDEYQVTCLVEENTVLEKYKIRLRCEECGWAKNVLIHYVTAELLTLDSIMGYLNLDDALPKTEMNGLAEVLKAEYPKDILNEQLRYYEHQILRKLYDKGKGYDQKWGYKERGKMYKKNRMPF